MDGNYKMMDVLRPPFVLGGITHPDDNCGEYYRLDASNKEQYSEKNQKMALKMSGANVRFSTDADKILVQVRIRRPDMGHKHVTPRGCYGIDIYIGSGCDRQYCGRKMQMMTDPQCIEEIVELPGGLTEVMIELPLYAGVEQITVGIPEGAAVEAPSRRKYRQILFYGSSITQGGCAGRPGNAYANILCRMLDADCRNLGFSDSALGEQVLAEYIAKLKGIDAFVMDYDHNNEYEGLKATHYPFYETVRKAHPDMPILMVTRPYFTVEKPQIEVERQQVIRNSYERALANGDRNVYFVCSDDFFDRSMPDLYAVDMTHPNDLGMYSMAKAIYPVLKKALENA